MLDEPSTWWQVWQQVRAASLTPEQLASPLMKRPCDLRHSGVTWRLNSGVPAASTRGAWRAWRTCGSPAWTRHSTQGRASEPGDVLGTESVS